MTGVQRSRRWRRGEGKERETWGRARERRHKYRTHAHTHTSDEGCTVCRVYVYREAAMMNGRCVIMGGTRIDLQSEANPDRQTVGG